MLCLKMFVNLLGFHMTDLKQVPLVVYSAIYNYYQCYSSLHQNNPHNAQPDQYHIST